VKWTRRLLLLFTTCAVWLTLIPLANGQATLDQINSTTPPARIAQLVWDALTVTCKRQELPRPSVFLAATETELLGRNTPEAPVGSVVAFRKKVIEYQISGKPQVKAELLSEADRLNGLQFIGHSVLPVTSRRGFYSTTSLPGSEMGDMHVWRQWITVNPLIIKTPTIDMTLQNGKWTVSFYGDLFSIDNVIGSGLRQEVKFGGCPGGPCKETQYEETVRIVPCSHLLSENPLPDEDAATDRKNEAIKKENEEAAGRAQRLREEADERVRLEQEAQAKTRAEDNAQRVVANRKAAIDALRAAEITISVSEFEQRFGESVKNRVAELFGTNTSQYQDAIRRVRNLVQTCPGILANDYASAFTATDRPRLWSVQGGKFGNCQQYFVRAAQMHDGGVPLALPRSVPAGPGLVITDTLQKNWKAGAWIGPKFHIDVYLDSPESFNLFGSAEARVKYLVISADIAE
jgi:hypothetical protein